jgi:BarA-like signal transduction histidine kinase
MFQLQIFLLHFDEWDRVVALPRHKFVTGATLLQLGSNQFLSVNIGVIRLLSVITTTPSSKNNVSLINTGPYFRH